MSTLLCMGTRTSRATKSLARFAFLTLVVSPDPTAARLQVWRGLKLGTAKLPGSWCRFADAHPVRDSLLIKSAAIAFLHRDDFCRRSNLRLRKAMAAFLVCWRAELDRPNHVQPDQHCGVARRVSYALRPDVGAGTENFRANAKSLRAKPRWAVRAFSTGCRWNQNV